MQQNIRMACKSKYFHIGHQSNFNTKQLHELISHQNSRVFKNMLSTFFPSTNGNLPTVKVSASLTVQLPTWYADLQPLPCLCCSSHPWVLWGSVCPVPKQSEAQSSRWWCEGREPDKKCLSPWALRRNWPPPPGLLSETKFATSQACPTWGPDLAYALPCDCHLLGEMGWPFTRDKPMPASGPWIFSSWTKPFLYKAPAFNILL